MYFSREISSRDSLCILSIINQQYEIEKKTNKYNENKIFIIIISLQNIVDLSKLYLHILY